MEISMFQIQKFTPGAFNLELELCHEDRNGPARHSSEYVVASPAWDKPRAFCRTHLEKCVGEYGAECPDFATAWEQFKKQA